MGCDTRMGILTPDHAHIKLKCRFRMLFGLREKTNSRLCDNKQTDMMGDTDITRELGSKRHFEEVIGAVNLCRDKQEVAHGDGTTLAYRRVEMSIAGKESEDRIRR